MTYDCVPLSLCARAHSSPLFSLSLRFLEGSAAGIFSKRAPVVVNSGSFFFWENTGRFRFRKGSPEAKRRRGAGGRFGGSLFAGILGALRKMSRSILSSIAQYTPRVPTLSQHCRRIVLKRRKSSEKTKNGPEKTQDRPEKDLAQRRGAAVRPLYATPHGPERKRRAL